MPYVFAFISLKDTPGLHPKGADLGVKPSASSCPLLYPCIWDFQLNRLRTRGSRRGCLCLGRNSNSTNCSRDYLENPEKNLEAFSGLTLFYELTWRDVIYVLGQTLTPDSRTRVWGDTTTFGEKRLKRETRGRREHEIALLPTRNQVVPIKSHFVRCILEGLNQAHAEILNYAKFFDIEQGGKDTPDKFQV